MIEFTKNQLEVECKVYKTAAQAFLVYEPQIVRDELKIEGVKNVKQLREFLESVLPLSKTFNKITSMSRCRECQEEFKEHELIGDLKLCKNCINRYK